jgi:hypothetical protein
VEHPCKCFDCESTAEHEKGQKTRQWSEMKDTWAWQRCRNWASRSRAVDTQAMLEGMRAVREPDLFWNFQVDPNAYYRPGDVRMTVRETSLPRLKTNQGSEIERQKRVERTEGQYRRVRRWGGHKRWIKKYEPLKSKIRRHLPSTEEIATALSPVPWRRSLIRL